MNLANKENPGPCRVGQTITVGKEGKPSYKVFELSKLTSSQLRKLAINFGCKGGGGKTKFACRMALASRVDMGTACDSTVNPASTTEEKKTNTMMRIINCCFLPRFRQTFLELNDQLSRQKFEQEGGDSNNPIKEFWKEVSNTVNDTEEEDLAVVVMSGEEENHHMHQMVTEQFIDLNAFNQVTWQVCRQHMCDLIKARSNVIMAMKESGHHNNDEFGHLRRKHLTVRKQVVMPGNPVYYLIVVGKEHPALDQAHTQVLGENLRSDSHVPIDHDASSMSSGRKKTSNAKLIEALEKSSIAMTNTNAATEAAKAKESEVLMANRWDECLKLSETIDKLREGSNVQLLFNFAKRVRDVEALIGIKEQESIVGDIVELPTTQEEHQQQLQHKCQNASLNAV